MIANRWSETAVVFLVGLGVGAALGVLLAPSSGEVARDYLRETAEDVMDAAAMKARKLSRQVQETIENAEGQVKQAADVGTSAYQQAKKASA
jgi:gas vesicle protein